MNKKQFETMLFSLKTGITVPVGEEKNAVRKALLDKGYWKYPEPHGVTTNGTQPILMVNNDYELTIKGYAIRSMLRDPLEKIIAIRKLRDEFGIK